MGTVPRSGLAGGTQMAGPLRDTPAGVIGAGGAVRQRSVRAGRASHEVHSGR